MSIACENIRFSLFFVDGTFPSSETQGQIVGTRESLNGRKNMARRKVKNGEKSPWGQCLTSSKRSPPFFLLIGRKNTKVFWHQSEVRFYLKAEQETDRKSIPFLEEHHSWFHFVCKNNANFNELKLKMNTLIHASQSKVTVY